MFGRKKGFTATQSKLTSHRMRSATLGTHVQKRVRSGSRHMNADSVGFANSRKKKRAARGVVDTLLPSTVSGESSSEYSRRVSRREFTQEIQRKARVRRIVFLVAAFIVVAAIASGVGVATFFGSLDSKMGLKNSDAKSALVAPKDGAAWYALLAADLGAASASADEAGPDALLLARVDENAKTVSLVSIPPNLAVTLKDGKTHKLREAADQGDASLISAVSGFAGVSISHYAKIDAAGITGLVNALGGIEVDVKQEVDDPTAGDVYLPAGVQTLDGNASLTYLRAKNFKNGIEDQTANQRAFFSDLALRMLEPGDALSFANLLDSVGGNFQTDMGATATISLADKLRGIEKGAIQGAQVPGYESTRNDVTYYVSSDDAWTQMMKQLQEGQPPVVENVTTGKVDRGSFTVEVRNGAAITGGAAQLSELLKADGFNVTKTGNADVSNYAETLVVYDGDAHKAQAEEIVSALGVGRTVVGLGYYTYEADVLVVLGKDWKPVA